MVDLAIELVQSFVPSGTGGPMARRTFDVIDVTEILVHWHAGRSLNEMSQSLGVDRKTIRKYIAPAVAAGIVPGGPAKSEGEWQGLVREWFPELADARLRQVTWPAIGEHHDYIAGQLKAGVRMSTYRRPSRLPGGRPPYWGSRNRRTGAGRTPRRSSLDR